MIHGGRCHCAAIGYDFSTELAPSAWPIRACQCSFCRAHAALSTSDPRGSLVFHAHEPDQLERYRFGLRTADFLLCRRCGVYIGAQIDSERGSFGIVNTRALTSALELVATPMTYEGEDILQRTQRRESRWTPIWHG